MWCWRRMQKVSWTDHVRNEGLLRFNEQRNILHVIRKRKTNWIGHILRRNCLLWQVIEGKIKGGIELTGRRGRRRRKLLDDLKERREYSHLKEEALDRTIWRAGFGQGFGPVVRQPAEWMNELNVFTRCLFSTLLCNHLDTSYPPLLAVSPFLILYFRIIYWWKVQVTTITWSWAVHY
jgi:hypothetical protein